MATAETVHLIARKDRIAALGDLKGKTIGVTRGSAGEFFLGRLLNFGRLGYDPEFTAQSRAAHKFNVRLPQALLTATEDQARWMIENDLTGPTTVGPTGPNYLKHIHMEGLDAVSPEAVSMFR